MGVSGHLTEIPIVPRWHSPTNHVDLETPVLRTNRGEFRGNSGGIIGEMLAESCENRAKIVQSSSSLRRPRVFLPVGFHWIRRSLVRLARTSWEPISDGVAEGGAKRLLASSDAEVIGVGCWPRHRRFVRPGPSEPSSEVLLHWQAQQPPQAGRTVSSTDVPFGSPWIFRRDLLGRPRLSAPIPGSRRDLSRRLSLREE